MATFIMLTRMPEQARPSTERPSVTFDEILQSVRANCAGVEWRHRYAILGPADTLDIFEAPTMECALQVASIVRRLAGAVTEVWGATQWSVIAKVLDRPILPSREIKQSDYFTTTIDIVCE